MKGVAIQKYRSSFAIEFDYRSIIIVVVKLYGGIGMSGWRCGG